METVSTNISTHGTLPRLKNPTAKHSFYEKTWYLYSITLPLPYKMQLTKPTPEQEEVRSELLGDITAALPFTVDCCSLIMLIKSEDNQDWTYYDIVQDIETGVNDIFQCQRSCSIYFRLCRDPEISHTFQIWCTRSKNEQLSYMRWVKLVSLPCSWNNLRKPGATSTSPWKTLQ